MKIIYKRVLYGSCNEIFYIDYNENIIIWETPKGELLWGANYMLNDDNQFIYKSYIIGGYWKTKWHDIL